MLTATQVAERLGVRIQTVYAYVSRGLLTRTLATDGRTSLFDPAEVERAWPGGDGPAPRHAGSAPSTSCWPRPSASCGTASCATAATTSPSSPTPHRSSPSPSCCGPGSRSRRDRPGRGARRARSPAGGTLVPPAGGRPGRPSPPSTPTPPSPNVLAAVTAAVAATEPLRVDLQPTAVADQARNLLSIFAEALPRLGPVAGSGATTASRKGDRPSFAGRLWPRLSPLSPSRPRRRALDAALVLLADNELATSTLAARVAASTRAAPHAVVLAGLATASGPAARQGGRGRARDARRRRGVRRRRGRRGPGTAPQRPVGRAPERQRAGRRERTRPGAGQWCLRRAPGWRRPRLRAPRLPGARSPGRLPARTSSTRCSPAGRGSPSTACGPRWPAPRPGTRTSTSPWARWRHVGQMPVGRTEAIFAIARTAGWIAHALEEYVRGPPPLPAARPVHG